ncbi:Signal transduction histidine kinase [Loktanella fryxellensis]|uniref:histidine kinase n=1 Tax=Loktanella fryxellensis TaxID=245187 RepID=A0A1H7ZMI0_9RHOB|nr:GAF domain-containing protein [Loktanella fryxellensis]SEM59516.1 Signal transduction histidine kinase [Loktanella fryxellensis]
MPKSYTFEALGLLHGTPDTALANIATLAALIFGVPLSCVTVVDRPQGRQHIAAGIGPLADLLDPAGLPLEHSVCRFVQDAGSTVAISDLQSDPRTADNPVLLAAGLRSYIGSPIHALTGKAVGTICCMSQSPRNWTPRDIAMLEHLAANVDAVVRLRALERQTSTTDARMQDDRVRRAGYAAHLGHEIRTPLTGIVAATRLLGQASDPAQTTRLVGLLDRSASKLLHFVSDVMDLAEVDGADAVVEEVPLSLRDLMADLLSGMRPAADAKGIALHLDDRLGAVRHRGDAATLSTVMRKVLGNAIRFTDEGSVTLRLQEDAYGQVLIDVIDTGCGVAPAFHDALFEEFEAAEPNAARAHGGTGLGLAIVRRMIEGMDGSITLRSTPGHGATVAIALPLQPVVELAVAI